MEKVANDNRQEITPAIINIHKAFRIDMDRLNDANYFGSIGDIHYYERAKIGKNVND